MTRRLAVILALGLAPSACGDSRGLPTLLDATPPAGVSPAALAATSPADNALTEARAQLGRRLFYDARLSRTGDVACATCHQQRHAFAEPTAVSRGVGGATGTRNAPALVNLAWSTTLFWDGRTPTLEKQAGQPIENPIEMNLPLAEAVARVGADADYAGAFADAYGGAPTEATLRRALASFVRTLASGDSPYDRHLRGDDTTFGAAAARGEALFFSERGECFHCHPRGSLTNDGFFNNGTYATGGDRGRQALTGRTGDLGKFKVPGLRNIAASAPYMHDGSLPTLEAVIDHYDRGGGGHPSTDPQIQRLGLTSDEKTDLVAFLRALTDEAFLSDPRFGPP